MAGYRTIAVVGALAVGGCRESKAPAGTPSNAVPAALAEAPACAGDSLRPATAAPAEGLWVSDGPPSRGQVAAMIGPAQVAAGELRVTRRVETLEVGPGTEAVRYRLDKAAVRLELLPPRRWDVTSGVTWNVGTEVGSPDRDSHPAASAPIDQDATQPAAAYRVTALVLLASYEPCDASAPHIRYLRRDARDHVVTDVMLRRESGAP
jgi:hypothetical protein